MMAKRKLFDCNQRNLSEWGILPFKYKKTTKAVNRAETYLQRENGDFVRVEYETQN